MVGCDYCDGWVHFSCEGIGKRQARKLSVQAKQEAVIKPGLTDSKNMEPAEENGRQDLNVIANESCSQGGNNGSKHQGEQESKNNVINHSQAIDQDKDTRKTKNGNDKHQYLTNNHNEVKK